ncbi:MAG: hypothetical protein KC419_02725 [Anaerolineales bacterium]|nr:hypothetical protein [Anaerolineales bacterium]
MNEQDKQTQDVLEALAVLQPKSTEMPKPARQAWAQMQQQTAPIRTSGWGYHLRAFFLSPARRVALTAVFLILVLGTALSFPTVRAAAGEFLGLFRVQKFAAVSISPEQIAMLQQLAEQGLSPGELEIYDEPGAGVQVESLAAAKQITGLESLRTVPALGEPETIIVTDGGNGRFVIDVEGTRAILEAAGLDADLVPADLDNAGVRITVFAGVEQQWANGISLLQTESPIVEYPGAVNPELLGSALLQMLGMSAAEADRLAQQIDWTGTLLLPIPTNAATFNEVTVEGNSGIALTSLDGQFNALIWQRDSIIHLLMGEQDLGTLLNLAQDLE